MKLSCKFFVGVAFLCLVSFSLQYRKNEERNLFDLWANVPGAMSRFRDPNQTANSLTAPSVPSNFNDGFSNTLVEGWLSISSPVFKDESKFPVFSHPDGTADILTTTQYTRINERFKDPPVDQKPNPNAKIDPKSPPGREYFYFRLSARYLYFSEDTTCINVLGNIDYINHIDPNSVHFTEPTCFIIVEKTGNTFKYCGKTHEDAKKFVCKIQSILRVSPDDFCEGKNPNPVAKPQPPKPGQLVEKVITQPYILIPLPREMCNETWDYENNGQDWQCLCKEGKEQSPIDLPPVEKAIGSPVKALFNFDKISYIADEDYEDKVKSGDNLKLQYHQGALRIFGAFLGKTVTMDGGVYHAQKISFHTPSEHTINGERFPMEMQILHVGKTIGDTAKHLVLSFVFKKAPGVYNKFLEALDFFNLPNPLDKSRDLEKDLFLPNIFYNVNEEGNKF